MGEKENTIYEYWYEFINKNAVKVLLFVWIYRGHQSRLLRIFGNMENDMMRLQKHLNIKIINSIAVFVNAR